jgi:F420-dependent oxidoreductase-like protein
MARDLKLGLQTGYWAGGPPPGIVETIQEAEKLGYDSVWTAEAYGSDCLTPLAWWGSQTERIHLGTALVQISARQPAATAMAAMTMDHLSGGRFILGLGVSGPQVVEGWYGMPFAKPLARTREYVDIVRLALSRERVRYDGKTYQLPLPDGPGKALHLMVHPVREHLPIYIASIGPKNLELTGEIADGWLAVFFAPKFADDLLGHLAAGRAKAGKTMDGFDVVPSVPLVVGDDVEECAKQVRPYAALYIGGMGSREQNFYNDLAVRMGYGDAAAIVQEKFLAKDYQGAAEAVPHEFVDSTALLGPPGRIAERMAELAAAGATTLSISPGAATMDDKLRALETAQEALAQSGVSS